MRISSKIITIVASIYLFSCIETEYIVLKVEDDPYLKEFHYYRNFVKNEYGYLQYYIPKNTLYYNNVNVTTSDSIYTIEIKFIQTYDADAFIYSVCDSTNQVYPLQNGVLKYEVGRGNADIIKRDFNIIVSSEVLSQYFPSNSSELFLANIKLGVYFYPKEFYENANQTAPGYITVKAIDNLDIPFIVNEISDWSYSPSLDDSIFALNEWGSLSSQNDNKKEFSRKLLNAITDTLYWHQGTPSDSMNLVTPFEQYRRLISGKDKLWCANWAEIYSEALSCFNIPNRRVAMGNIFSYGEPTILLAEGHRINEIFDPTTYEWKYVDLSFGLVEARFKGYTLNVREFHYLINQTSTFDKIEITEFDIENGDTKDILLIESKNIDLYFNFFNVNQKFIYLFPSK